MLHGPRRLCVAVFLLGASASPALAQTPPPAPSAGSPPPPQVDPELTRPLTPLDQFTVAPPTQRAAPAPAPSVAYTLDVSGLDEVGLAKPFRQASALEAGKGKAASELQIRQRAADDVDLIERLLHTAGYYQGQATITPRQEAASGRFRVTVVAVPGKRFHFGSIAVSGPETQPPGLARKALTLQPGDPIVADQVRAAEAEISLRLPERGYPFVKVGDRDIALDPADATGAYVLPVESGPRSSFGAFDVKESVFSARHLAVIARFKPGELYDSRKVDDFRRALMATSLFSSVGVKPVQTGRPAPDGTEAADLRVYGRPAPPRTLSASLGYETGVGPKIEGSWSHLNLFPPEGALTLRAIGGSQQQLLGLEFRRSNAGRRDRTIYAQAQTSREDTDAYKAYTAVVQARVSRESTPIWQKRWTYSAGVEGRISREQSYNFDIGAQDWRTYKVAGLRLAGGYDRSDSLLNPTRGFQVLATLDPEAELADGTHGFLKTTLEGRTYLPLGKSLVLAGRLRLGALFGINPQDLAPTQRFYAGGGDSIRGFGFQQVGPKAPDDSPLGGSSSTTFSLEGRYRFGNFGVVGFVDGGQVYETATPRFSDLRYGVGVGARYYTNFGPIRFDVATPIARRPGESVIGVYISIGQAF